MSITAQVIPVDWLNSNNPPSIEQFRWRFLAEGDSWFSLNSINIFSSSNFLFEMKFSHSSAIICCAHPGDEIKQMVDKITDDSFYREFARPNFARYWDAIIISASGNDLIAGINVTPLEPATGKLRNRKDRLLLTPAEVINPADPAGYISSEGWARLSIYLQGCFKSLISWRQNSPSANRPIITHTYSIPVARPAGILPWDKGWLYPALELYQVPPAMMQGVVKALFSMLRDLLLSLDSQSGSPNALSCFHVFDSSLVALDLAMPGTSGSSGDWINEIHLTKAGYKKVAPLYAKFIENKLNNYPN